MRSGNGIEPRGGSSSVITGCRTTTTCCVSDDGPAAHVMIGSLEKLPLLVNGSGVEGGGGGRRLPGGDGLAGTGLSGWPSMLE